MSKRMIAALVFIMFIFTTVLGRCLYIALDKSSYVSDGYNSYKVDIGTLYTNIYDRKGVKLNNLTTERIAIIEPDEKSLNELETLFSDEICRGIIDELSQGYPVKRTVTRNVKTKYIKQYDRIVENTDDMPARHILDRACGGLEEHIGKEIGSLSVNYTINARGELLEGDSVIVRDDNYSSSDGVVVSLDRDLQLIAENAAESISKGAVVILDCDTSQILASVSRGDDYVNRALSPYAIGSVFKLVVACCAIENDVEISYDCKGSIKVGDTTFHCQKSKAHGKQSLKEALANSCNCYFIELANKLGAEKLYKTAVSLGFGSSYELYDGWEVNGGSLPTMKDLSSAGELSLFGFGQGKLTDTPVHFASVIAMLANGGCYNCPTLDIKATDNNQVISSDNAKLIRSYMRYVVTNGTGAAAEYNNSSAGKTSTAQSGIYVSGREVLNTFFAGFYPYDKPQYAIVVMCEDGTSGAADCCPVFRTIVENIDKM